MKKIILTVCLAFVATMGFAQTSVDNVVSQSNNNYVEHCCGGYGGGHGGYGGYGR